MNTVGNQPLPEYEYTDFLDKLSPFLRLGQTLYSSIVDAGLLHHKTAIYVKYRLGGDFAEKIDLYRSYPGKLANNILTRRLMLVDQKIKQGLPVLESEMKDVRFFAEKHRSSQLYFVNRNEVVTKSIEELLDELDEGPDTINDVAENARIALGGH